MLGQDHVGVRCISATIHLTAEATSTHLSTGTADFSQPSEFLSIKGWVKGEQEMRLTSVCVCVAVQHQQRSGDWRTQRDAPARVWSGFDVQMAELCSTSMGMTAMVFFNSGVSVLDDSKKQRQRDPNVAFEPCLNIKKTALYEVKSSKIEMNNESMRDKQGFQWKM